MIDVKEIRIGSILRTCDDISVVDSIIKSGEDFLLHFTPFSAAIVANVNDCDGVELTPEILEKCGINKDLPDLYDSYSDSNIIIHKEKDGYAVFATEWTIGENFKYLHQLQNLYYALTNTELTITL